MHYFLLYLCKTEEYLTFEDVKTVMNVNILAPATSTPATTIATSTANYKRITNCSISNQRSKQANVCSTTDAASNNRKTFIYKL